MTKSSWIRKMFEEGEERKARFGKKNVFDFSLGNPNLEPPSRFKEVIRELAADSTPGLHGYMPNAGFFETRQAVADYLSRTTGPVFTAQDIIMTVGAGGGLNVVLKTLTDPEDEVIIPKPYFVEYDFYLDNHQAAGRIIDTHKDFSLDMDAVEKAITDKTKAVLINSPNNPTGRVYPKKDMESLASLLSLYSNRFGKTIYLISDEPYRKIIYDNLEVPSIFDVYTESIVVTSFSKDLSIPGERIGYVAIHPEMGEKQLVTGGMTLCNRILGYVNAPAFIQRAISYLLDDTVQVTAYQEKRDLLCAGLADCGYHFKKPEGAFYLFPKSPIEDDVAFVRALQEENILTVPGSGFGGPGHFRIAYCVSNDTIEKALPGFKKVIKKHLK